MAKASKGAILEISVQEFFEKIFAELDYQVLNVRKQKSGTQNGFDIHVQYIDNDNTLRNLFFECKDYETQLDWAHIVPKILQLEASNYNPDGFVCVSPKIIISNIDHNMLEGLESKFAFPISFLSPDNSIEKLFALDSDTYNAIYGRAYLGIIDREAILSKFKSTIEHIHKKKQFLKYVGKIEIDTALTLPVEEEHFTTNLDRKLNAVFEIDDPDRIQYHQYRCDYKVYLESLTDINNTLRNKILNWQDNLRIKASRLTKKFESDENYTPTKFFHDFFDIADKELLTFYNVEKLDGYNEKLLHGVIFELAAECPLDWRKKHERDN